MIDHDSIIIHFCIDMSLLLEYLRDLAAIGESLWTSISSISKPSPGLKRS
jgi:hypothetical protein